MGVVSGIFLKYCESNSELLRGEQAWRSVYFASLPTLHYHKLSLILVVTNKKANKIAYTRDKSLGDNIGANICAYIRSPKYNFPINPTRLSCSFPYP